MAAIVDDHRGLWASPTPASGPVPSGSDRSEVTVRWGQRFGRFELLARIASDDFADIYVARLPEAGARHVTLKIPHLEILEAEALAGFDDLPVAAGARHPNLVVIEDVERSKDGQVALVMDYVDGASLFALLQAATAANEEVPAPVMLRILLDALSGLGATGPGPRRTHREASPTSLLVAADGSTRVLGVGMPGADMQLTTSHLGRIQKKLRYMAPEQLRSGRVDARSEIFSLMVVAWEALAGRPLFEGAGWTTIENVLGQRVPPLRDVRPELAPLDAVFRRALARAPAARYPTCAQLAAALRQVGKRVGIASHHDVAAWSQLLMGDELGARRSRISRAADAIDARRTHRAESVTPAFDEAKTAVWAGRRRPMPVDEDDDDLDATAFEGAPEAILRLRRTDKRDQQVARLAIAFGFLGWAALCGSVFAALVAHYL